MTKVLDILLPVIGCGLLLALIVVMVRRKLHREYRFFFRYVVFTALISVILLLASGNDKIYSYTYWMADGLSTVFALFAMNELFHQVFSGFYSFRWFRWIFPGIVTVTSVAAIWEALLKPFSRAATFGWVILSVESALSLTQVGVVLAFLVLALGLRVHWRRYPFYIALGFAVSGAGEWMSHAILSEFHNKYVLINRYLPPATYICATLLWLWSFSGKFVSQPELNWETMPRRNCRSGPARTDIKIT